MLYCVYNKRAALRIFSSTGYIPVTEKLSHTRRRRLLDRTNRCWESNPALCLDSVEHLLLDGEKTPDLLLLKARALSRLIRPGEAGALWAELLDLRPDDPELALALCQRLVTLVPKSPVHRCKLGSLYQSFGRMAEAERAFEQALSIAPDFQPAWYFLAQLRKWNPGEDHLVELRSLLEAHKATRDDSSAVHYALAKELEDLGQYEEAFHHLQRGAQQIRQRSAYDSTQDRKLFCELQTWYESSDGPSHTGPACEGPVFILGMPRTGSTLADRIVSSHSEVESVGGLMCFKRAVEEVCGGQGQSDFFASFFGKAPPDLPYQAIGARYLEMLAPPA